LERSFIVVIVTTANREEAEKIVESLLEDRLIACANIIGPVSSLFWWNGKIERACEHVLLMKSRKDLFEKLSRKIKGLYSYEVPEILALPIVRGSSAYMKWLDGCLKSVDE
jgi:periplasmic divalent cation tolerance protein